MQSFRIIVSLSCISLILFGFQNCSPMSTKVGELPSASSDTALGEINAPPSRDVSAPSVMIDSPTANTMISGTVTISAVAVDDSGVRGVQFFIDGAAFGAEDTSPPFSISWDTTTVTSRSYTLGARARDAAGNIAQSAEVVITVDNRPPSDTTAPVVSITSPAANANVNGTINLTATATDNVAIAGVQFFIDGSPVGAEDTSSPYSVSFNTTTVQNGNRSLTARARDTSGNTTMSAARTISVNNVNTNPPPPPPPPADTTAPAISISAPAASASVSGVVALTATASDNVGVVGVQFYINNSVVGVEDTSAPYSVDLNTTTYANGSYTVTARARDAAGNTTMSAARSFTINNVVANPMATFTYVSQNILIPKCAFCHGGSRPTEGISYDTYTDTMRTVRANSTSGSKAYTESQSGSMPASGARLTAAELRALADWINAGAPNN